MSDEKIKYLKHPVSAADKKKWREQGYKIIDARFAPEGEKTGTTAPPAGGPTKNELKAALDEAGVEYPANANKADLAALLEAHQKDGGDQ